MTYDSATDQLAAEGFALLLDDDGSIPSENILNGSFSLTATIDGSGNATAGTLSIGGGVLGFGPSLLEGTLAPGNSFGFQDGGGPLFEFLFTITGGELAPLFMEQGNTVGVILSGTGFGGSFNSDFDNLIGGIPGTGFAVSDVAVLIPAPGALALLVLAGVAARRRRRPCVEIA